MLILYQGEGTQSCGFGTSETEEVELTRPAFPIVTSCLRKERTMKRYLKGEEEIHLKHRAQAASTRAVQRWEHRQLWCSNICAPLGGSNCDLSKLTAAVLTQTHVSLA